MLVKPLGPSDDEEGASLLMVMFAVVFVAGIISVLLTTIDGGTRQNLQLNQTQSKRIAASSALQASEALVAKSTYSGSSSTYCLYPGASNKGSLNYTDSNGLAFNVACELLSAPGSGTFSDGGFVTGAQIGADAVVLTGSGASLIQNGKGSLNFGGNLRAAGNVVVNGAANGACTWPYVVAPQTTCGQVALDPGMAWIAGTCASAGVTTNPPGLFPLLDPSFSVASQPYCKNMANTSSIYTANFQTQITTILNQEPTQLPALVTTNVANYSALPATSPLVNPYCTAGDPRMHLRPGYYTDGATLTTYTGGDSTNKPTQYYVNSSGKCTTTSGGATKITTVVLDQGQYFFNLTSQWIVANQMNLVGGTSVTIPKAPALGGGTMDYYKCSDSAYTTTNPVKNAGVELVFGATSSAGGANVNGIVAGDGTGTGKALNRGAVTMCGNYDGTHVPVVIYGTTGDLPLYSGAAKTSPFATVYKHSASSMCDLATLNASNCSALLSNNQYGSFNVFGTVFAPRDALNFILNPVCVDSGGNEVTYMSGQSFDCELDNGTYSQQLGQVSIYGGVVAAGMQTNNPNTQTTGSKIAQGTAAWLPAASVPTGIGGGSLDLGFTACSPSATICSFLAQSEAAYLTPVVNSSGSVLGWSTVKVHKWLD